MFFRKKDEVKKKKQSEMAAKYPSVNPRTDVTAVVTRKSAPEWAATSSRKAAPAVLRNVNEKPQLEKLPLNTVKNPTAEPAVLRYTGGKPTAEPAVLRARKYAVQAATGWKQYQTDESNRTRLAADRSYQKWQSRGGVADAIDVSYKPAKNWRVSENNTFGYLYAENKERAHSYAKSLNDLLSKQMDEIGDSLREGAQGQAEKIKDWGEKVWNTHTEAQQANATAHEAQAEQVGQIGKQVLQKGKAAAEEAWKQQAEIQNRNSVQQIQRGKSQADAAMKAGENMSNRLRSNIGVINDATLSNQMGAGVYGFLKSASVDEQNEIENVDKQKEILRESVTGNLPGMVGGFVGARGASALQPLDMLKSGWEFGLTGNIDLSGGEFYQIKDTIDNAISNKLGESLPRVSDDVPYIGGMGADDIYEIITDTIDDGIALKMPSGIAYKSISEASERFHEIYEDSKRRWGDDKLAIKYATLKAFGQGAIDIVGSEGMKRLNFLDPDDTISKILSEGLKDGMFEIISQAGGRFFDSFMPDNQSNSRRESEETAEAWRNGMLSGVVSGSAEKVIDLMKIIIEKRKEKK